MKHLIIIGDGMADMPVAALNGKTPLEYVDTPNMDYLAAHGESGRVLTVPQGYPVGTDTAFYSIMGFDVDKYYTGRSPLEAAGMGIALNPDDVAFRCNLAAVSEDGPATMLSHNGGQVEAQQGVELMRSLVADKEFSAQMKALDMTIHIGTGFRHIATCNGAFGQELCENPPELAPPHDIVGQHISAHAPRNSPGAKLFELMMLSNKILKKHPINTQRRKRGELASNCIWFWGQGTTPALTSAYERYGLKGAIISAIPLVNGIGVLSGLDVIHVDGATGELDTNYRGKAEAAVSALKNGYDFSLVHVEAPDECSHDGSLQNKCEAIKRLDGMVGMVIVQLMGLNEPVRILLMSDHLTSIQSRLHTAGAVPYCIFDAREDNGNVFSEACAESTGIYIEKGYTLLNRFFEMGDGR